MSPRLTGSSVSPFVVVGCGRVGNGLIRLANTHGVSVIGLDIDDDLDVVRSAQVVVEATPEELPLKRRVLTDLLDRTDGVVLTTTSSFALDELAGEAARERLGAFHPFTPVHRRPIVEIAGPMQPLVAAQSLADALHCKPIQVEATPGLVANRILKRWSQAAIGAWPDDVDPRDIDSAFIAAGHRIGPLALLNLVGPTTSLAVSHALQERLGPRFAPPDRLAAVASHPDSLPAVSEPIPTGDSASAPSTHPAGMAAYAAAATAARDEAERILDERLAIAPSGHAAIAALLATAFDWPRATVDAVLPDDSAGAVPGR